MPKTHATDHDRVRRAVLLGLFSGTGVGLGYLLAGVPGVELMTLNAALAGLALGRTGGAAAGALAAGAYSLGSPFGPPIPLVLAAQMAGQAASGWAGGLLAPALRRRRALAGGLVAAPLGAVVALIHDLLTNLAVAVALDLPLAATLLAGVPLAALHLGTAAVAFGSLLPVLAGRLGRLRRGGLRASGPPPAAVLAWLAVLTWPVAGVPGARAQTAAGTPPETPPRGVAAGDSLAVVPDSLRAPADSLVVTPDSLATTPDSLAAAADTLASGRARDFDSGTTWRRGDPRRVGGWEEPLWRPFFVSLHEDLTRRTAFLPVRDGGQGAPVVILGEPGTAPWPRLTRGGLPLHIGHRYLDDPEAIATAGRRLGTVQFGLTVADGGLGGQVDLARDDPSPAHDRTDTRWFTGPHESYLRTLHLLTAEAPWRVQFAFHELLDNEGYDFRAPGEARYAEFDQPFQDAFWGHAKFRSGRGTLTRDLGPAGRLTVAVENVRKLKKALPALDKQHQDLWTSRSSLDWQTAAAGRPARLALWWNATDVDWDRDLESGAGHRRIQEGTHQGVLTSWGDARREGRLQLRWGRWTVRDTGADPAWAPAHADTQRLTGEDAAVVATRTWPLLGARAEATAAAWWAEHGGWLAGGAVRLREDRPQARWQVSLERGGRAPRADELGTAWSFVTPGGRRTVALPAAGLGREDTWRLAAAARTRLAGLDLAVDAAVRRLRDGIAWAADPGTPATGRWRNGLDLDGTTVRLSVAREGRFLGWVRIRAAGTWRHWSQSGDLRWARPPERDWRLSLLWENHLFREDGIIQLGAFLTRRGAMDDPWDLAGPTPLPAITRLDAIVGFRLVGTNLSLGLGNLTGAESRLSAGAVDHGLELRWRLHWVFTH